MSNVLELCNAAKSCKYSLGSLSTAKKIKVLSDTAKALVENAKDIIEANAIDIKNAKDKGMKESLIDRLTLTEARIQGMADGIIQVSKLSDPIGECTESWTQPNGMTIAKIRVPMGVIGVIYEARPNVTADVFALCFFAGSAVVLKGGSDAINSNKAIVKIISEVLKANDVDEHACTLIEDTSRESTMELMKLNGVVDLLIPRGSAGLIRTVVENATIPVIETGTGNCHVFVDKTADFEKAINIIINAKTQRTGVCNACESLCIHNDIAAEFLPRLNTALKAKAVEVRADEKAKGYMAGSIEATDEDYGTEYLDLIISVKTVASVDEAIEHINKYNTGHSECIVTEDEDNANKFLANVDAACVYHNVSTRFTDGFEFGFGAEIGISTQKLHARGPMGLKEITSYKYLIKGNGQVRG